MVNAPTAETRDEEPSNQILSEENHAKLKEVFSGCKKIFEIKSEMSIILRKFLNPSIKSSLKTSKLPWGLSQIWTFIMWQ
jgi:hypothetical protein